MSEGSESLGGVILASAGTGKTYQLTNRYLALMARGEAPESILATTFTRKAAGEIFDRIVRRLLAALGEGEEGDAALAALRDVDPGFDRGACTTLLRGLCGSMHRLHVRTIDSFFVAAALSFSLEVGLLPGWRIVEEHEDDEIRRGAIDRVLEAGDRRELAALVHLLAGRRFARSVHESVLRAVRMAHGLYVATATNPGAWEVVRPSGPGLDASALEAAIEALERLGLPRTKTGGERKHWVDARERIVGALRGERWGLVLGETLSQRIIEGAEKFSHGVITGEIAAVFRPLLEHARVSVLGDLLRRNIATRDLMARFDVAYREAKRASGAFCFDDIPRMLLEGGVGGDLEEMYYRLDGRIAHLLLDEFQDTSVVQFRLLEPMLNEMLSDETRSRTVLCVGDVKQSLYSWRDAEPELLVRLAEMWPQLGEPIKLERSYRSSPVVLDAVNGVFGGIGENGAVGVEAASRAWSARFRAHEAAPGPAGLPGRAALLTGPEVDGSRSERRRAVLEHAAHRVATLRASAPTATLGVLVRTRKQIPILMEALSRRGVDASKEGGNPVTDCAGVSAAVSLMWMADHPGDTASRFHVATSPIGPVVGLVDHRDRGTAGRVGAELRRRLTREGYASVLGSILDDCAASLDERGHARFRQLIDLAHRFDEGEGGRPAAFARFVRVSGVEEPGRRPVRVMTIHHAKGLEFDAVVLPDLDDDWSMRSEMLFSRERPLDEISGVSVYAGTETRALDERLASMHGEALARRVIEELCVLYVGMTRAVHCLEMIVEPVSGDRLARSASGVLRASLASSEPLPERRTVWERESGDWAAHVASRDRGRDLERAAPEEREIVLRRSDGGGAARAPRRSPSSLEGGRRVDLREALRIPDGAALERGTLVHAWFEGVEWIEDGVPDDEALLESAAAAGVDAPRARAMIGAFREMVRSAAMRDLLGRDTAAARLGAEAVEARREAPFAVRDEDGAGARWLLTGRFDRLVIGRRGGEVVGAEVIDFKTDDVDPSDAAFSDRVAHYEPQVRAYRRAASRMLGVPLERVAGRLAFVSCDRVVEVGGS